MEPEDIHGLPVDNDVEGNLKEITPDFFLVRSGWVRPFVPGLFKISATPMAEFLMLRPCSSR